MTESMGRAEAPLVPDLLTLAVPPGARVLVVSDIHLGHRATPTSLLVTDSLANELDAWVGPGALVLAGDIFELLGDRTTDPAPALDVHPRFRTALQKWGHESHHNVIVLPGNHDGALAWHHPAIALLAREFGARVTLAAELEVETASGLRRVRVEHGHRFDPANAFSDPRNALDTPLGHHVVSEFLPAVDLTQTPWLKGLAQLIDGVDAPAFAASRIAYRRVMRYLAWFALPFIVLGGLRIGLGFADFVSDKAIDPYVSGWLGNLTLIGVGVLADIVLLVAALVIIGRRTFGSVDQLGLGERGITQNDGPRAEAERLFAKGVTGYITGHTHYPELTNLGEGFYANSGCGDVVVERRGAHLHLPPVFASVRRISWIELEAGADLHVHLLLGELLLDENTVLERIVMRKVELTSSTPSLVGARPGGPDYPPHRDPVEPLRRPRRIAATGVTVVALIGLLSGVTPPLRHRADWIADALPIAVPQAAAAVTVLASLGLLWLATGVRRGQRHAWMITIGLLSLSTLAHITKGLDVEEAGFTLAILAYLLVRGSAFRVRTDRSAIARALATALTGGVLAIITAAVAVIVRHPHLSVGRACAAVIERLIGIQSIALPGNTGRYLSPGLLAVGFGLLVIVGRASFGPMQRLRHHPQRAADDLGQARQIVMQYGGGTLDYFALRDDKTYFFHQNSLVAYAVHGGVALVSPDPIGPRGERRALWSAFRQFCDSHGWVVAVMAANESWLETYRASGMHDLYIGDEAIVDSRTFSLDGGEHKSLRQAVNRIARNGYRIEFHDPALVDERFADQIRALMIESRRGDVERGFSMTLSRLFDPRDRGLLLAVAFGPDGKPAAFCQYVPAPEINGFSLDLMRRSAGDHPNGLTDFVIVETLRELDRRGMTGLALNFATVRAVLAGEAGDGIAIKLERWLAAQMSDEMQIESLWKYNAKFDPQWRPRYAVYDGPEHIGVVALAIARAESLWELPVIGRFLEPRTDELTVPVGS